MRSEESLLGLRFRGTWLSGDGLVYCDRRAIAKPRFTAAEGLQNGVDTLTSPEDCIPTGICVIKLPGMGAFLFSVYLWGYFF